MSGRQCSILPSGQTKLIELSSYCVTETNYKPTHDPNQSKSKNKLDINISDNIILIIGYSIGNKFSYGIVKQVWTWRKRLRSCCSSGSRVKESFQPLGVQAACRHERGKYKSISFRIYMYFTPQELFRLAYFVIFNILSYKDNSCTLPRETNCPGLLLKLYTFNASSFQRISQFAI